MTAHGADAETLAEPAGMTRRPNLAVGVRSPVASSLCLFVYQEYMDLERK